jgi:hypothetical protein
VTYAIRSGRRRRDDQARKILRRPIYQTRIVLFVFVMLVATFVTVEGTLFVVKTLVIGNPNNPLTKTGGLSPFQDREMRKGK